MYACIRAMKKDRHDNNVRSLKVNRWKAISLSLFLSSLVGLV